MSCTLSTNVRGSASHRLLLDNVGFLMGMQRNIDASGPVEMVAQNETPKLSSPCREAAVYRRLRGCRGGEFRGLFWFFPLYTTTNTTIADGIGKHTPYKTLHASF